MGEVSRREVVQSGGHLRSEAEHLGGGGGVAPGVRRQVLEHRGALVDEAREAGVAKTRPDEARQRGVLDPVGGFEFALERRLRAGRRRAGEDLDDDGRLTELRNVQLPVAALPQLGEDTDGGAHDLREEGRGQHRLELRGAGRLARPVGVATVTTAADGSEDDEEDGRGRDDRDEDEEKTATTGLRRGGRH